MAVKRITTTTGVGKAKPARAVVLPQKTAKPAVELDFQLPETTKGIETDFAKYLVLIYGREKIGKSTLASQFPNAIFFTTEPGIKGLDVFELNSEGGGTKSWDHFRRGVMLVEQNPARFRTVVVDTVDRAYDMCLDWVCENRGIEYPGTDADGEQDYGKSWRAVRQEFLEQIHRIVQVGVGVVFISHAKESLIKTRSGDRYHRIHPTMSGQARAVVEALVDFFFYAEYMKGADGVTKRILICEGDEFIWAGARQGVGGRFPQFVELLDEGGYDLLVKAFLGKYKGISPTQLRSGKDTTQSGSEFLGRAKAKAVIAGKEGREGE